MHRLPIVLIVLLTSHICTAQTWADTLATAPPECSGKKSYQNIFVYQAGELNYSTR